MIDEFYANMQLTCFLKWRWMLILILIITIHAKKRLKIYDYYLRLITGYC